MKLQSHTPKMTSKLLRNNFRYFHMLNNDIMFTLQNIMAQKLKICNTEHWFLPQKTAILDFCTRFVKCVLVFHKERLMVMTWKDDLNGHAGQLPGAPGA